MKRLILAALLGLALAAGTASAHGGGSYTAGVNFTPYWGSGCGKGGAPGVLGPWYLYWPLEAHFITPPHPQYPYWPSPYTLPGGESAVVPPMAQWPAYWH
jgi:hypothetical protein